MPRKNPLMNISALTQEEYSYLLGLYLTDGYLEYSSSAAGRKKSHLVTYSLQGNEEGIADKIAAILERSDLRPHIQRRKKEDSILVKVYSTNLNDFFPDKQVLLNNDVARKKFFQENRLLEAKCGISFLAGLLDGDGSCPVIVSARRGFGCVSKWNWSFSQTKYPFLVSYIRIFVESLALKGDSLKVYSYGKKIRIFIYKPVAAALLNAGIGKYSWKVVRWMERTTEVKRERKEYYTVGQVAKMLGLSAHYVWRCAKAGKLSYIRRPVRRRGSALGQSWLYIPVKEAERFREGFLTEEERMERTKRDGVKIVDAANMLRVSPNKLYKWCWCGKVQATRA